MCGWQIRNQGGGAEFGGADTIVGYECEGCQIGWREGAPYATGKNGAAANFEILATAPTRWEMTDSDGYDHWRKAAWSAVVGTYSNRGTVVTVDTTDWSHGLKGGRSGPHAHHQKYPQSVGRVMMLRALLLFGCFMLDSTRAAEEASLPRKPAAEPLVLDVWPGKVPEDTGVDGDEKFRMYSSPLFEGPTKLITNVTKPMLMVYLPPKEQNTGAAVVICPGGGYHELFWELEGEEVAAWLNAHGIAGIILKYRVPRRAGDAPDRPPLGPQMDAQRAISLVRSKSAEWGIDPKRIGMVGFSVGGHLVVATATGFKKRKYDVIDKIDDVSCRPDFGIACYSGYLKAKDKDEIWPDLNIPEDTPPIFLTHAADDNIASADNSSIMYQALKRANVPAELHIFATGGHDFGVRQTEKPPAAWTRLCLDWLRSNGILKKTSK
jgi:acetyl esterase/lipase